MFLKLCRIFFSVLIFSLLTLTFFISSHSFINIAGKVINIQLLPAFLRILHFDRTVSQFIIFFGLILLTLEIGRGYCSGICPLGTLQDIIIFISRKITGRKYSYNSYPQFFQQGLLILLFVSVVIGNGLLIGFLDPYSIYGKIITNLCKPFLILFNNIFAFLFKNVNIYIPVYTLNYINLILLLSTIFLFLIILLSAFFKGRIFCNLLCPLGAFFRFITRFSRLKIIIDDNKCVSCGLCEKLCKAECINSMGKSIDTERCINCFNCLDICNYAALNYQWAKKNKFDPARRNFIIKLKLLFLSGIFFTSFPLKIFSRKFLPFRNKDMITPPGSISVKNFLENCIRCHLCISKCPTGVITSDFIPYLDYNKGYCEFECNICSQVCPTKAILPLGLQEKQLVQLGIVKFIKQRCIVYLEETSCGACSEHCPTKAVYMIPYKKEGLTIPEINNEVCIGCGNCQKVCPVKTEKAILVLPHLVHKKAKRNFANEDDRKYLNDSKGKELLDDFPF